MKYIIDCPSCGRKIRFPLDRGRIKVSCRCGYTTLIDPDDTALYKSGEFDLKTQNQDPGRSSGFFDSLNSLLDKFTWHSFINELLEIKYKLQNIKHLPDRERNKIVVFMLALIIIIAAVIYIL
ncbi:MAG TPA: hypothetical protein PK986_00635 [Spirochaetota bacterium]|nr:hypothetical protein [Spirochaetota bacterium]HQO38951.1 hypothetical protein [Spirochaetota bacterium]